MKAAPSFHSIHFGGYRLHSIPYLRHLHISMRTCIFFFQKTSTAGQRVQLKWSHMFIIQHSPLSSTCPPCLSTTTLSWWTDVAPPVDLLPTIQTQRVMTSPSRHVTVALRIPTIIISSRWMEMLASLSSTQAQNPTWMTTRSESREDTERLLRVIN